MRNEKWEMGKDKDDKRRNEKWERTNGKGGRRKTEGKKTFRLE